VDASAADSLRMIFGSDAPDVDRKVNIGRFAFNPILQGEKL